MQTQATSTRMIAYSTMDWPRRALRLRTFMAFACWALAHARYIYKRRRRRDDSSLASDLTFRCRRRFSRLCHRRQGAVVNLDVRRNLRNPRKGRPDQDRGGAGDGDDDAGEQHLVHGCRQQQETADAEHPPDPQAQLLVDDVVVTHRLWRRISVDHLERHGRQRIAV